MMGSVRTALKVVRGDIRYRPCDMLVLKHADGFRGADKAIAEALGFDNEIPKGQVTVLRGRGIQARNVAFVGVGALVDFRYEQIKDFGRQIVRAASFGPPASTIATTPHGVNYGLDEDEAFLSLISGILDELRETVPEETRVIEIVEIDERRADRYEALLADFLSTGVDDRDLSKYGANSERKGKIFVAMPFAAEHTDVWEIAIQESVSGLPFIVERIDGLTFTGDILTEIKQRIQGSSCLIALLTDANPNVFLELGFAWGVGIPTVLLANKASELPFDVKGQRCLIYSSIANLRKRLSEELHKLYQTGTLTAWRYGATP